jgi:purine nucleoside permease
MAGAALGVRFYTRRRVHFDLSAHIDLKMSTENYETDFYNQNTGNTYQYFYSTNEILFIPGFRLGLGF